MFKIILAIVLAFLVGVFVGNHHADRHFRSHGVAGVVSLVERDSFEIRDRFGQSRKIFWNDPREANLKINERVLVIGETATGGGIKAKIVRLYD